MDYSLVLINVIIIIDICILVFAGFIFHALYRNKVRKIATATTSALQGLLDEAYDVGSIVVQDDDLIPFYEKLKTLSDALHIREENRREVLAIANSIAVNIELSLLLEDLLPKIVRATNSSCAAFYLANHATNKLEIKASIGFSKSIYSEFDLNIGEGIIGSITRDVRILTEIPDDSVYIFKTFLGKIKPKSMMVIPITNRDQLVGILALASIYDYVTDQNEIVELIRYYVGISVGNTLTYEQTKRLTNELKFQNTLIQNLNEDLERKVNNRTIFLNSIIDSITDYAIYAFDINNNVVAWNKGAEHILGYLKDEVIGKNVEEITIQDSARLALQDKIDAATSKGRYEESGWRAKKDGTQYFADWLMFPMYNAENGVVGFTVVIKDITYIKNVEKALGYEKEFTHKILEASHEAVVVVSQQGVVEMANKKSEELLESKPLVGLDLCSLFMEPDFLRRHLVDVALRYGKGEWRAFLKKGKKSLRFNVFVMMAAGGGQDSKLFLYLNE